MGKLGICGKLLLKGTPGGGQIFLIICLFEMHFGAFFSLKYAEKKSKKHILGKHNQTDLVSAAWREAGKKSEIIRGKNHTSVI